MKIPRSLGRYEVVDLIGRGGMGALYRARDPRIGRYVAIKLLRRDFDTPELRDRFSREARAAGSLSHPNIVTIYDVGEDDGLPFIAMEYVRGETFADLVGLRPPLSVLRKVQLTEEVCAGLSHAHEAGIVHRDIKPANLIVGPEGTVKILDFGIAKLSASGTTVQGAIIGTLNYMSPEQVKGTAVDARADIFAVGAVLYELLSHQQAFPGHVQEEVLHRIVNGIPRPITEYCPEIDPRLVRAVDRALEKDPDRRFQDIASLQKELATIRLSPLAVEPRFPPNPADRDLTKRRAQQIDDHLTEAAQAFDDGHYDAAIESCKRVLMLDATEERAISQLDRVHAAIDGQQVQTYVTEAREQLSRGEATAAMRDLKEALALDPHNAEAQALGVAAEAAIREKQEEARIRAAVDDARRRFVNGEHQAALQLLEALGPASHSLVARTLEELHVAVGEIEGQRRVQKERLERQRRIAALLDEGRAALQGGRLDDALGVLELLGEIDASLPELAELTGRVQRAQTVARLNADLERIFSDFEEQLTHNDLPRAGELLKTAVSLAATDSRTRAAGERLEQATAALAAREAAEARRREGEQKVDEAAAHLESGDLSGAADMLTHAAELAPQHPRIPELWEQLREATEERDAAEAAARLKRQVAELIESASQRFRAAGEGTSELVLALRDVTQALAIDPESSDASSLKTAIEASIAERREVARVTAVINNARTRFANGKHQAALRLLEDFQPASRPEIVAALTELRGTLLEIEEQRRAERQRIERQERVAALLAEARTALREHRFDAALGLLSNAGEIDAAAPDLSALMERARQEQAAARLKAELDKVVADLDKSVSDGDLSSASDLLKTATALDPADRRVLGARRRVEQAIAAREAAAARTRDLEEKNAAAEELLERGDLQGAMRLLKLAANLDSRHPRTVLLSERVEEAIRKEEADEAAERMRRTVDELLGAAAEQLQSADLQAHGVTLAMQKIAQALALVPDHAGAQALKATAEDALAAQRQAALIRAAVRNARSRFAIGKHQAAFRLLDELDPSSHPIVAETLKELREALHEIEERRRAEQELVERQRQTAAHIANARAAIEAKRFTEALDALSAARLIDPAASGLPELTEQASRGQAAAAEAAARRLQQVDTRERERKEADRQRAEGGIAEDEEATRLFQAPGADVNQRNVDEVERPLPTPDTDYAAGELTLTGALSPGRIQRLEVVSRHWRWGVVVGVGVLLLVVLVALFRPSQQTLPLAPRELPSLSAPGGQPQPVPPSAPSPPVQPTFAVTLTGTYPFEVVLPGGVQRSANTHRLILPEGTTEVRLRNSAHFLDVPISIKGVAGETLAVSAPALASLTVSVWNTVCEIAIDGRRAGYHPLTQRLVTGSHLVSIRCPDGTIKSKRVVVSAAQSEPVTFTERD